MSLFIWAQVIGAVAVVLSLAAYQIDRRQTILRIQSLAAFLYALSFLMLGALTGAMMNVIGGTRAAVFSSVVPSRRTRWIFIVFIGIAFVGAVFTWQGPLSLLALGGTLAYALAGWNRQTRRIRRLAMLAPPLWFTYNLVVHSYPGMAIEVFVIVSNFIGQYRFDFGGKMKLWAKN